MKKTIWSSVSYREIYNSDGDVIGYWMGSQYYSKKEMDEKEKEKNKNKNNN